MTSAPDSQTQGHEQQGPHRPLSLNLALLMLCVVLRKLQTCSHTFLPPKTCNLEHLLCVGVCAHGHACVEARGQLTQSEVLSHRLLLLFVCLFEKGSFVGLESPDLPSVADQSPADPAVFVSPAQ